MTTATRRVMYSDADQQEPWMPTGGNPACAYERAVRTMVPGTGSQVVASWGGYAFHNGLAYPLLIHVADLYPAVPIDSWTVQVVNLGGVASYHSVDLAIASAPIASHSIVGHTATPRGRTAVSSETTRVTAQEQIDAIQDALSLGITHIAQILHVGRDTVHRWVRSETAIPRDADVARRLRQVGEIADSWRKRSPHEIGSLVTAPLGDGQPSLYDLLRQDPWDSHRLEEAFERLAARITARHERSQRSAAPETPVGVQRQQLRQLVQRGRYYGR